MVKRPTDEKRKKLVLNRSRAKEMRREPTAMEEAFWDILRNRQVGGFKVKRQVLIEDRYIADFICLERRVVIELDGPLHDADYDARRDRFFAAKGLEVLRFSNRDAAWDTASVRLAILHALERAAPSP